MLKIKKSDSQILKDLKLNQNRLTKLDVNFLMGTMKESDYKRQREELRKNVVRIINENKLREKLKGDWKYLK